MSLNIDEFLDRLNRKGTLNPVSKATKTAYRNTLEQFERFLDGRQLTQELAQEWLQQLLDKGRKPATVAAHGFALRRYFSDFLKQKDAVILVPTVESESIPDCSSNPLKPLCWTRTIDQTSRVLKKSALYRR